TVNPNITPTFTAVNPICSGATLSGLPTTSNNGITGTWLPALNNTQTTTYVFTPTSGQCATTTTTTITVNPNITPTFIAVNPICSGATLSALPTTSNNGITGTWSPALNNTQTTTYTFTPSSGQCATTASLTITVNPNITPTFTAVNPICSGATLSALPTTSNNGITGTWSPALNNTQTTTYTFTPSSGQCATTTTITITVNSTPTPTGQSVQTFNVNNATLDDLIVNPIDVIWYVSFSDANSGINPLPIETILINGATYYAVATSNECPSVPFEVTVSVTLGTNSFNNLSTVAYPIPSEGLVFLSAKSNINEISVTNTMGQTIIDLKINNNNSSIDLSTFANGLYYLKIQTDEGIKIIKLIKK
ncbi:MAG: T9SS type A sorting domain-containing protein, partial [Flavobacterium sp.]|uniref:T9SS type A sorting domain-containing protein n=1 Tax=Flavobacterium sp. TaxID=239 RepID=UPI0026126ADE